MLFSHVAVTAVLCSVFAVAGQRPPLSAQTTISDSPSVKQLLAEGNDLTEQLYDHHQALQKYLDALALNPNNDETLWRICRVHDRIARRLPASNDDERRLQLATFEQALEYANKSVAANRQGTRSYTWRAIIKGRIALFRGVWESTDLAKQIRVDLEKAIDLDPLNDLAWYTLGRTHAKLSERPKLVLWPLGLSWATMEEAMRCYERAISLRPDFIMYYLDYARACVDQGEYDKARAHLVAIETLPTQDEDDERFRKEAKALLEKIDGK